MLPTAKTESSHDSLNKHKSDKIRRRVLDLEFEYPLAIKTD